MKIQRSIAAFLLLGLLSGCSLPSLPERKGPSPGLEAVPASTSVVSLSLSEHYYRISLPYRNNETRGIFAGLKEVSLRSDLDRLELGLLQLAQNEFSTDQFLFQEGQVISAEEASEWLSRHSAGKNPAGLNPEQGTVILVHILEHDYLDQKTRELAGIVLGLTLNPYYVEKAQDGRDAVQALPLEQQREQVKKLGEEIVRRIRAKGVTVPVVVAGFAAEQSSSLTPGRFILTGLAPANKDRFDVWEDVDEQYLLLPAQQKLDGPAADFAFQFTKFQEDVQKFFSQYAGVVGMVRFISGKPVELTITVTAEYSSKTAVIAFTQYVAGLLQQYFPEPLPINVYIRTVDRPEAVYVRPAEGEPFFHVYR